MKHKLISFLNSIKGKILGRKIISRCDDPRASIEFIANEFSGKELIAVEIGTCYGYNAKSILNNLNISKLYLVDPYKDYDNLTDDNGDLSKAKINAHKLINEDERVVWIEEFSSKAADNIPNNLDFVYIDGNHSYDFVKRDIEVYYNKLKCGGVLAGHDIENGYCKEHDGIVKAVMEFALINNLKLYIHAPDWWIIKGEKAK